MNEYQKLQQTKTGRLALSSEEALVTLTEAAAKRMVGVSQVANDAGLSVEQVHKSFNCCPITTVAEAAQILCVLGLRIEVSS